MPHLDHLHLARASLSCLCLLQGISTFAIDYSRTHAKNPLWIGHARFHVVWQSATVVLLSVLELGLTWWPGPNADTYFYLASLLAAASPLGFLLAFAMRRLFAGTLSDANGIPPFPIKILGTVYRVDLNLFAVILALASLLLILAIYKW